jgi:hypothetical protein
MSGICGNRGNGEIFDLFERHRAIPGEALVLGRDLSCPILELPRRICENRPKSVAGSGVEQVFAGWRELINGNHFGAPTHGSSPQIMAIVQQHISLLRPLLPKPRRPSSA